LRYLRMKPGHSKHRFVQHRSPLRSVAFAGDWMSGDAADLLRARAAARERVSARSPNPAVDVIESTVTSGVPRRTRNCRDVRQVVDVMTKDVMVTPCSNRLVSARVKAWGAGAEGE
jgi:hypothetical protein